MHAQQEVHFNLLSPEVVRYVSKASDFFNDLIVTVGPTAISGLAETTIADSNDALVEHERQVLIDDQRSVKPGTERSYWPPQLNGEAVTEDP